MAFRVGATLALVAIVLGGPVRASAAPPVPVLLELFTSEGCSSCPPADELLEQLDRTQPQRGAELIVLSEHIDYWDALGWKDPFSSAQFTNRQYYYAGKIDPSAGAYTPELVVDGRAGMVGSDSDAVFSAIGHAARAQKSSISIHRASREGARLTLHVEGAPLDRTATLYVALADDHVSVHVERGENAGRTLSHVAVVRSLTPVGVVSAQHEVNTDVALPLASDSTKTLRVVTFLQDQATGAILAIASQTI
jgi:hypothetical protein